LAGGEHRRGSRWRIRSRVRCPGPHGRTQDEGLCLNWFLNRWRAGAVLLQRQFPVDARRRRSHRRTMPSKAKGSAGVPVSPRPKSQVQPLWPSRVVLPASGALESLAPPVLPASSALESLQPSGAPASGRIASLPPSGLPASGRGGIASLPPSGLPLLPPAPLPPPAPPETTPPAGPASPASPRPIAPPTPPAPPLIVPPVPPAPPEPESLMSLGPQAKGSGITHAPTPSQI